MKIKPHKQMSEQEIIDKFVEAVERRAEAHMLKTGKLEGAHYAAMKQLQREWREKARAK